MFCEGALRIGGIVNGCQTCMCQNICNQHSIPIFLSSLAKEDPDTKNAYDRRGSKKKALTNSPSKGRRACDVKASTTPSRTVLAPEDPAPGVGRHGRLRERRERRACVCSRLDVAPMDIRDVHSTVKRTVGSKGSGAGRPVSRWPRMTSR